VASLVKRGKIYSIQWRVAGKIKRRSLRTSSFQIAKAKLRDFETRRAQGVDNPLPTRTPIGQVVAAYVQHVRTIKTGKSAQSDVYVLRQLFGTCCPELEITSRRPSPTSAKRPVKRGRRSPGPIEADCFEMITTAQIAEFIDGSVRARDLAPKTANRMREILNRLFNWAINEGRVRMPADVNPARRVRRYREPAPEIRYLTLPQIDEQLAALADFPQLRVMVATYIYAGLRREEAMWLTREDVDLHAGRCGMIRVQAKTIGGRHWQPKTRVNRAVPVSTDLARYLVRYRPRPSDHGWYFPSPLGRWWDPDNFSADLRAAQNRAGLIWTCLDFRHTFGSQLAQAGVTLLKIATLMGNSPEICRRHYAALVPEALTEEVEFHHNAPTARIPMPGQPEFCGRLNLPTAGNAGP